MIPVATVWFANGARMLGVERQPPIPLKNPGAWKILNFRGIKSPRLHGKNASTGVFRASFFDRTIIFFAAFEKLRVFQRNRLLRRDPIFLDEINVCPTSVCFTQRIQLLSSE